MDGVRIIEVDERDSSWEDDRPRFRVYVHGSRADTTFGSTVTYDVTGADVLQVIDWAQRHVTGQETFAVALVVDDTGYEATSPGHGRGLVWLLGTDGTNSDPSEPVADAQRRMLTRRAAPVGVPEPDRMPAAHVEPLPPSTP